MLVGATATATLSEAVGKCTLVIGTGTRVHRRPEQTVVRLPELAPLVRDELERGGRIGLMFGPEKHGLTREDLSFCHVLVEIPTDSKQPSMNLGQAVAVCLYELSTRVVAEDKDGPKAQMQGRTATSGKLELLASVVERAMIASDYSPGAMREVNRHDLRLMLRRLAPTERDVRRILGLFRKVLWRIER